MDEMYLRFESVVLRESGLPRVRMSDKLAQLGLDSLDIAGLVLALEDEFGIEIPDEIARVLLRSGASIADAATLVADACAHPHQMEALTFEITERYMPELLSTPYRIDSKTLLLRNFLSDSIFRSFLGSACDAEKAVLLTYFEKFGGQRIRNLFGVPVREDGKECFYIVCYLDEKCGLLRVDKGVNSITADAFADIEFGQVTLGPNQGDHWAWALRFADRIVYLTVHEQFSSLVLARLKEVKRYLSAWSFSEKKFLGSRHVEVESKALRVQTADVLAKCFLSASVRPPTNVLSPSNLREFLRLVPNENKLIQSIVEPVLRGRLFEVVRSIHHGSDDTSQERGADVVAVRRILGDAYVVACVVKRGNLRKRGNELSVKLADVVEQSRLALSCTVSIDGVDRYPDAVYVVVSGEVPEDLKRDLQRLNRDRNQRVFVWDRPTLIDLYLESNVSGPEQYALYAELASAT